MTRPRPSRSVRAIVESAVPSIRVEAIALIPTKRPLRTFKVKLADERILTLHLPPLPAKLLRSEQWMLQSEAALLEWLSKDASKYRSRSTGTLDEKDVGQSSQRESSLKGWTSQPAPDALLPLEDRLLSYLPTLVKHSASSKETGSAFSLFEPTLGDPISSLGKPLTRAERHSINFQKGRLVRHIANVKSPNGRFGLPVTVFRQSQTPENTQREARECKLDSDGANSWRRTFHILLEAILRDGEDQAVTISYQLLRTIFDRFGHLLDAVKTSRLVVCDADEDDIVLVSRSERTMPKKEQQQQQEWEGQETTAKVKMEEPDDDSFSATNLSTGFNAYMDDNDEDAAASIKLTGLRDWSACIFGDPLFATVFSHATPEFDRGFRQSQSKSEETEEEAPPRAIKKEKKEKDSSDDEDRKGQKQKLKQRLEKQPQKQYRYGPDIIDDPANAATRILLYECYHATVSIVKQFYRPDADSSERELAARRRLVAALAKLNRVGDGDDDDDDDGDGDSDGDGAGVGESAGKRPRRRSRDDWPAKRPRGDTPMFGDGDDEAAA
ncbi:hypothetical protein F5Y14DRAFT_439073 [Nemania sp. NC0429]|nr:hypothetical protein F5Y14DRAFT_439073 [Nemania sp. NC0429]